jgi:iron complex outermembrane recepter protein
MENILIKRKHIAIAVINAMAAMAVSGAAYAQTAEPQKVERVEVTGSNIKRIDSETALPVTIITRAEIERSGATSAADLIERLSANNGGGYNSSLALGDSARPGFAGASLRGLGSNNTLVLLNGRRLAVYAFDGGAVNLGAIPIAAIERVELLRDGASAVYGSDAIAGVINFITRRDFNGGIVEVYGAMPGGKGDGQYYGVSATVGYGDLAKNGYNGFLSFNYNKQEALKASDRSFSQTAYIRDASGVLVNRLSSNSYPANILTADGFVNPYANAYGQSCSRPTSFGTSATDTRCRFDYASVIDVVTPTEKMSVVGAAAVQINANHKFIAEFNYASQKTTFTVSPVPASEATTFNGDPLLYPANGRYYPGRGITPAIPGVTLSGPLNVYYRTIELGGRANRTTADEGRLVLGLEGVLGGWDYKTGVYTAESKVVDRYVGGWVFESKFLPAVATGNINLWGPNDAAGLALLRSTLVLEDVRRSKSTNNGFDFNMSREIAQLPAGPLAVSVGGEARQQKYSDVPLAVLNDGDVLGGGGNQLPVVGKRNVTALFGEASIPIIKNLEAQLAVRYDRYSDFGNAVTPKASLRWQPMREVLVRGSYGEGFRAPTLPELLLPLTQTNTGGVYDDPLYGGAAACAARFDPKYCNAQLTVRQGGNPDLKPEKSKQFTLGFVVEPTANVSLRLDYFNIDQRDVIGILSADTKLADYIAKFNPTTRTSSSIYANDVFTKIDAATGRTVISYVKAGYANVSTQKTSGLDASLRLRVPKTAVGDFTFGVEGTYLGSQKQRSTAGGAETENVGQYALFGPVVRFKHTTSISLDRGPWNAWLGYNYQSAYQDQGGTREVSPYETWDAALTWSGIKNLKVKLGIRNLTDRNPPFTVQNSYFQVGFDPTYVDPRGRTYRAALEYKFR